MVQHEIDTVLTVRLGACEIERDARILFGVDRGAVELVRVEILVESAWRELPWALSLMEDSAALADELRDYAAGRLADARCVAADLRRGEGA